MTLNNDILPNDLREILSSNAFDLNGGLLINSIVYDGDDLIVLFTISFYGEESANQDWKLHITEIEMEKVSKNWTEQLSLYTDHFLLYEFVDNYIELYFNGKATNSQKLLADLYESHIANYDNNLILGFGINAPNGLSKLCTTDNGLFARGPKRLLENYEKCLTANGIKTNYIGEIEAEKKELKLLIFGNSYFIGREFNFKLDVTN